MLTISRQMDVAKIADWMGFIFYNKSPRFVSVLPAYMPQNSKRVGVFVNETMDTILSKVNEYSLDIIQLHGNEEVEFCCQLKQKTSCDIQIMKMIQVSDAEDLSSCVKYEPYVDYFLFETKSGYY